MLTPGSFSTMPSTATIASASIIGHAVGIASHEGPAGDCGAHVPEVREQERHDEHHADEHRVLEQGQVLLARSGLASLQCVAAPARARRPPRLRARGTRRRPRSRGSGRSARPASSHASKPNAIAATTMPSKSSPKNGAPITTTVIASTAYAIRRPVDDGTRHTKSPANSQAAAVSWANAQPLTPPTRTSKVAEYPNTVLSSRCAPVMRSTTWSVTRTPNATSTASAG